MISRCSLNNFYLYFFRHLSSKIQKYFPVFIRDPLYKMTRSETSNISETKRESEQTEDKIDTKNNKSVKMVESGEETKTSQHDSADMPIIQKRKRGRPKVDKEARLRAEQEKLQAELEKEPSQDSTEESSEFSPVECEYKRSLTKKSLSIYKSIPSTRLKRNKSIFKIHKPKKAETYETSTEKDETIPKVIGKDKELVTTANKKNIDEKLTQTADSFVCSPVKPETSRCKCCNKTNCVFFTRQKKCSGCKSNIYQIEATSPFCKTCREKIYMLGDLDTLDALENGIGSEIIKTRLYKRDLKVPTQPLKELMLTKIFIDQKQLKPLFYSPFNNISDRLYVCQYCFSYYSEKISLDRHKMKCNRACKGNLVYSKNKHQIYEVDGEFDTLTCRNLCLVAKCFLDHKTLYYDVEPFVFYLFYEKDNFIGYFSREKFSNKFNLSCIVVLPCYQGKGYGYFLIDFSYVLFQIFKKKGTPEKPLSDQGLAVYKKYWKYKVYGYLQAKTEKISISKIGTALGMTNSDVIFALELLDFLDYKDREYSIHVSKRLFLELLVCDLDAILVQNIRPITPILDPNNRLFDTS